MAVSTVSIAISQTSPIERRGIAAAYSAIRAR
jgi:hypothetical protein